MDDLNRFIFSRKERGSDVTSFESCVDITIHEHAKKSKERYNTETSNININRRNLSTKEKQFENLDNKNGKYLKYKEKTIWKPREQK